MGLFSTLFGGSKSSSTSSNRAYDQLSGALMPQVQQSGNFFNRLGDELSGGFEEFKKNSGFDFLMGEGLKGITGAGAARGLLRSGATTKDYGRFATGLGSQMYGNYLDRLGGMSDRGLQAAGVLAGAGQQSESKGKDKGGGIASLFSDRRLKTDIRPVGKLDNGLPVYAYRYSEDGPVQIGLMADEVEQLHPDAVTEDRTFFSDGPYKMVDYDKAVR